MPTFEFSGPDGKTYTIEGPPGATPEQAFGIVQQHLAAAPPTVAPAAAHADSATGLAKAGGVGLAKGVIGLAGLPGDLSELGARGLDRATRFIGDKLGLDIPERPNQPNRFGAADIQGAVEGVTGEFRKPQTTAENYAQTIGEFAPAIVGGPETLLMRGLTRVVAPALGSEAAGQATAGTKLEPYARIAGAVAGGLAPSALARVVTPLPASAARNQLVETLQNEGVTSLTAGQRTGSPALRYAESALGDAPFAGSATTRVTDEGRRQFTEAALRRAGTAGEASPEVLATNDQRLGDTFRDLAARNTLQMDQQFGNEVGAALRTYDRVPNSQQRAIVQGYADDIIAHAQQTGTMPGPFYQEMRSRLSRQSNSLRQSDPTLSETLRDMRDALDGAMARSISPADSAAWQTARQEYAAQKTIEKAASRAGEATAEGQIVPANLRNVVASGNNRGAYARGEGQFSELARAGAGVMGAMPQSGTGPRLAMHTLASLVGGALGSAGGPAGAGLGAAAAAAAGPAVAGRVLMSGPAQAYLGNQAAAPLLQSLHPRQAALINAIVSAAQQQRLIGR